MVRLVIPVKNKCWNFGMNINTPDKNSYFLLVGDEIRNIKIELSFLISQICNSFIGFHM